LFFVFSFISTLVLCFPSVSNFDFTSQYHQFPLSHAEAAATVAAAAIATVAAATAAARRRPPPKTR
jgi:Na+-transporting methylmalonyl-CoA/oxaloacetate decarboxylase gamma subunit